MTDLGRYKHFREHTLEQIVIKETIPGLSELGGRRALCPLHYYSPHSPRIFRPSSGSAFKFSDTWTFWTWYKLLKLVSMLTSYVQCIMLNHSLQRKYLLQLSEKCKLYFLVIREVICNSDQNSGQNPSRISTDICWKCKVEM